MPRSSLNNFDVRRGQRIVLLSSWLSKSHRHACYSGQLRQCAALLSYDTRGAVAQCRLFHVVCDSVEQIVQVLSQFLIQLQRAACRLLRPEYVGAGDLKPMPDLLRDLHTSKMTLCNSGPDIVPKRKARRAPETRSSRRRSGERRPLHPMGELNMDVHKSDNRHYYHNGRNDNHNDTNNNRIHFNMEDRDNNNNNNNNNSGYDEVDGPVNAREIEIVVNNNNRNIGNNNVSNRGPELIIPRISAPLDQHHQPALSTNQSISPPNPTQSHNSLRGNATSQDISHQIHVPDHRSRDASRGRLMAPQRSRSASPRHASPRHASPRPPARDMSDRRDNGGSGQMEVDHELTKHLVDALRSIGDNLEHKMRSHPEPSVQAVFCSRQFQLRCVGKMIRETFRRHQVIGLVAGFSLEILQQINRL